MHNGFDMDAESPEQFGPGRLAIRFHMVPMRLAAYDPRDRVFAVLSKLHHQTDAERRGDREITYDEVSDPAAARSVAEVWITDDGGHPELARLQESGGAEDLLSLASRHLKTIIQAYRGTAYVHTGSGGYSSFLPLALCVEHDYHGRVCGGTPIELAHSDFYYFRNHEQPRLSFDDLPMAVAVSSQRLENNDPTMTYMAQIWEARRQARVADDFDSAVIHAAIAVESLVISTWLAIQWEKGIKPSTAFARWSSLRDSRKSVSSVLGWLGQELGGNWDSANVPAVSRWQKELQPWRNSAVHTGEHMDRPRAESSLEIATNLQLHIASRMIANVKRYPRTCFLIAGSSGVDDAKGPGSWSKILSPLKGESSWSASFSLWMEVGRTSQSK